MHGGSRGVGIAQVFDLYEYDYVNVFVFACICDIRRQQQFLQLVVLVVLEVRHSAVAASRSAATTRSGAAALEILDSSMTSWSFLGWIV